MSIALTRQAVSAAISRLQHIQEILDSNNDVPYQVVKDLLFEAGENVRTARAEIRWSGKKWERLQALSTEYGASQS